MPKFSKYNKIFEPIQCGPMRLKNRIEFTPMVSCHADADGRVTPELVEYIGMQARTGAGLITIGDTVVDRTCGDGFMGALSMTRETDILGLSRLAEEAHKYGAKLSVEMNHGGNTAIPELLERDAMGVTTTPMEGKSRYVKMMDQRDIDTIVEQFVDCADRLMRAGFDAIMIHAAHGNLITQFLSPASNTRIDWYGGSLENRMRFPLQILEAVHKKVGGKIAIDCRISAEERIKGGMPIEETIAFLKIAQKYLDKVHISTGLITNPECIKYCLQPNTIEHCINVNSASRIKKELDIPVTVVGSISTLDDAERILNDGDADLIGMARALIVDGETVTKGYRGQEDKIRPCIRCYNCLREIFPGRQVRCSLNPVVGQETKYHDMPLARKSKKVMIVGGGPAGMQAAQTAVMRGHDVTLFEMSDKLGGMLHDASTLDMKADLKVYTDWMIKTTHECGANIVLNTKVTSDLVAQFSPDALFIATGATEFKPPIDGINRENIFFVSEVDSGKVETGQDVVVCGGGLSGTESAIELAKQGKNVTIVDMQSADELCKDIFWANRVSLMDLISENNIKVIDQVKIESFSDNGVEIIDKNWNRSTIKADSIVLALGLRPTFETVKELEELVPETYIVGDCFEKAKDIHNAIHTAFYRAVQL